MRIEHPLHPEYSTQDSICIHLIVMQNLALRPKSTVRITNPSQCRQAARFSIRMISTETCFPSGYIDQHYIGYNK